MSYKQITDTILSPGAPMQGKTVKSAQRTIELFEFFAEHQRPANLLTIAKVLSYPASSTAALVKSLCVMGYLHHNPATRTYFPTLRISLLGGWLQDQYFRESRLLDLMHSIAVETQATVVLAMQSGVHVQYLMVIDGSDDMRAYARIGSLRPICRASTGKMLLTRAPAQTLRGIVLHANSLEEEAGNRVSLKELMKELELCRQRGYATTNGTVTPGRGTVGMLLPTLPNHVPLSIGLGGTLERLETEIDEWVGVMRRRIDEYSRDVIHEKAPAGA